MKQFRQQRSALERANRQLTHYAVTLEQLTLSQERNRLARELYDTLAHTLSGLLKKRWRISSSMPTPIT
jgi:signal transduction histidine kinase